MLGGAAEAGIIIYKQPPSPPHRNRHRPHILVRFVCADLRVRQDTIGTHCARCQKGDNHGITDTAAQRIFGGIESGSRFAIVVEDGDWRTRKRFFWCSDCDLNHIYMGDLVGAFLFAVKENWSVRHFGHGLVFLVMWLQLYWAKVEYSKMNF